MKFSIAGNVQTYLLEMLLILTRLVRDLALSFTFIENLKIVSINYCPTPAAVSWKCMNEASNTGRRTTITGPSYVFMPSSRRTSRYSRGKADSENNEEQAQKTCVWLNPRRAARPHLCPQRPAPGPALGLTQPAAPPKHSGSRPGLPFPVAMEPPLPTSHLLLHPPCPSECQVSPVLPLGGWLHTSPLLYPQSCPDDSQLFLPGALPTHAPHAPA